MDLTNRMLGGSITAALRGKLVRYCASNGHILVITLNDGSELRVAWVDDNGDPIKGRPVVEGSGVRMKAERMQDLIHLPTGKLAGVG